MMEKLVEVSDQVVCIDFVLGSKCRTTVRLRSLVATATVAFKIQTSSPQKFLVNPPSGLISPLSQITFQIILKPQPQVPSSFPRSVSDRFLIRTSRVPFTDSTPSELTHSDTNTSWTQDIKLKVAFVGPFLLRHAVNNGDCEAVRSMVKIQRTVLTDLSTREAESLHRVATRLDNSVDMVSLLIEAGLKVESTDINLDDVEESKWMGKGWTELHVAVSFDRTDEVSRLIKLGKRGSLDCKDREGRTPLYLAASKGYERCVKVLAGAGANVDAKRNDGRTALYRAAAKGDRRMVKVLIELGADPSIVADHRGRSAIHIARDEGHKEIVEILERGEEVLDAARRGDLVRLELLLETDASFFYDQWNKEGALSNFVSRRIIYDARLDDNVCIKDMIEDSVWKWPEGWEEAMPNLTNIGVPRLNRQEKDVTKWVDSKGNLVDFETKKAWEMFQQSNESVRWYKVVWYPQCNPRHAFILWMAMLNRLQTQDRMMIWNKRNDMKCSLCNVVNDSHNHLFFDCEFSFRIWEKVCGMLGLRQMPRKWEEIVVELSKLPCNNSIDSVLIRIVVATGVYYVWKERNSRVFRGEKIDQEGILKIILDSVKMQLLGLRVKNSVRVGRVENIWNVKLNYAS